MKSFGSDCSGPKYGSSSRVRAPKNSISLPPSNLPVLRRRRRHSVIARIGALPVPVQIITMCDFGWFGIRKRCAERADHLHRVADLEVADVVRGHAAHRPALVVLGARASP